MVIHLSGPPGGGAPGGAPDGPSVPLFDLAPGGVYRADRVTPVAGALLPHRFTLTCALPGGIAIGGLFSVALSCRSPRLAVNQHPALWSPDLPRPVPAGGDPRRDGPRPPGRLTVPTIVPHTGRPCLAGHCRLRARRWPIGDRVDLTWRRVHVESPSPDRLPTDVAGPDALSITEFYRRVDRALRSSFPERALDHRGDPLDEGPPRGHCFIDLVDPTNAQDSAAPRPST